MSTASEAQPTDNTPPTARTPGALAIITATALGGVLGSRLSSKTPLVLAAGATALAWLGKKQPLYPPFQPEPAPVEEPVAPFPPAPLQDPVQQWLERQKDSEEKAPIIALPTEAAQDDFSPEPVEPEDDYVPQTLLEDDEHPTDPWKIAAFATLTEPVLQIPPPPIPQPLPEPPVFHQQLPEPVFFAPAPALTPREPESTWMLGLEPLPSWNEAAPPPLFADQFFAAPPQHHEEELPPPVFTAPVFAGGDLPDQIEVAAPVEEVVHLTPSLPPPEPIAPPEPPPPLPEPEPEPEPEIETPRPVFRASLPPQIEVQEIAVQLASPGEASFDSPLAAAPLDPWTPVEIAPTAPAAPPPALPIGPVVEAEIILRPRAPMQAAVVPKAPPTSPRFSKNTTPKEPPPPQPSAEGDRTLPKAPVQSPREQRARKTWRSWWRGD